MSFADGEPLRVLIAGGGVAGLEAALALRELAGDRVVTTMLSPEPEFVYRPLRVREPFSGPATRRYALTEIAQDIGIELERDALKWLDAAHRTVHTKAGRQLTYGALLLALGAQQRPRFKHALTLDDGHLDEQLRGLVQDVEGGYVHALTFIAPRQLPWPLPLYELALMTARRAYEMDERVSITIVTPEATPLALFGRAASRAVGRLLEDRGILFISCADVETPEAGQVVLHPDGRSLHADRVVALPELFGPSTPGVPKHDGHGFIPIDARCRVSGLDHVFAAGDATDFAIKHGSIASQQADVAAEEIATLAGASVTPHSFQPELRGILLGGDRPLYLSARVDGTRGTDSTVSERPPSPVAAKIAARHLAPYLAQRDRAAPR